MVALCCRCCTKHGLSIPHHCFTLQNLQRGNREFTLTAACIAHWKSPKPICYHCSVFSSWLTVRSGASPQGLSAEGVSAFELEFCIATTFTALCDALPISLHLWGEGGRVSRKWIFNELSPNVSSPAHCIQRDFFSLTDLMKTKQ